MRHWQTGIRAFAFGIITTNLYINLGRFDSYRSSLWIAMYDINKSAIVINSGRIIRHQNMSKLAEFLLSVIAIQI